MFRPFVTSCVRTAATAAASAASPTSAAKLKTLEIATKYTAADAATIIGAVNASRTLAEIQCFDITKGRAQAIRSWRNKNGPIESVDQLLEVDGFGVKNLDKFCASILRAGTAGGIAEQQQLDPEPVSAVATRVQQFTTPALTESLRSQIRTCTAIHVGITSVTWARLQLSVANNNDGADGPVGSSTTQLTDWCLRTITDKRMHVGELCENVLDVIEELPASDVYVLESPRVAQQGAPGSPAMININVQMAQIVGMVSMAMAARGRRVVALQSTADETAVLDTRRVLFLRQLLASRLFQTVVGLERISTASVVAALLDQSGASRADALRDGNPLAGEVHIAPALQYAYSEADGYCKEYMGQALLMVLAFMRLCVLRCPESLAAVSRQKKK